MDIVDFEQIGVEQWDAFVHAHPLASYGHLAANFAIANETPGMQNRSLIVRDGDAVVGVLPLFEAHGRDLRWIPFRQLVSGALFPAGPLISTTIPAKSEPKVLGLLLDGARRRASQCRADRVVISYPNVTGGQPAIVRIGYSPLLHHGYRARPGVGLLIDLCKSPEQLAAARQTRCKRSVAKAQATGATTGVIQDRDEWMACHDMNVQTLGELAFSHRQLSTIWDQFIAPGHSTAHAVYADGVIAAVIVTIQSRDSAYYWIGWRRQPMAIHGASHMALWSAILGSRDRGCRFFELGSMEFENAKNIGISEFKQSFGGTPYQTLAAELDVKPLKSAAVAAAKAAVARVRQQPRPSAPGDGV